MFGSTDTRTTIFYGMSKDADTGEVASYHAVLCRDATGAYSLDWTWTDTGQSHHILAPAGSPDMPAWLTLFPSPEGVPESQGAD